MHTGIDRMSKSIFIGLGSFIKIFNREDRNSRLKFWKNVSYLFQYKQINIFSARQDCMNGNTVTNPLSLQVFFTTATLLGVHRQFSCTRHRTRSNGTVTEQVFVRWGTVELRSLVPHATISSSYISAQNFSWCNLFHCGAPFFAPPTNCTHFLFDKSGTIIRFKKIQCYPVRLVWFAVVLCRRKLNSWHNKTYNKEIGCAV